MSAKRFNTPLYWCAGALLLAVIVFGLAKPLLSIGRYLPLDPNEGWNAYFGDAAVGGGVLYPPADALITNNYPPLSFYLVGAVGHLTGDNIFAGRVIALLSLLFVAWSIYYWLRINGTATRSTATRIGLLAATIFLAYAVTYGRDYVAMDDPQWLAHALMMGGLLVVWKGKDSTRHIILGAILMMAGGWTKHLLIPLPVSVSLWLLWRSRPAFAKWVISMTLTLAVAAALVWWLHGWRFFESLHEPRQYLRHQAIVRAMAALKIFFPLVVLWLATIAREGLGERLGFVSVYLIVSAGIGLFASGGAGVDVNAFFDLLIALCLAVGLAVESLQATRDSPRPMVNWPWAPMGALLTAVCVAGYAVTLAPAQLEQIRGIDADERAALHDIEVIKADGAGRAACEMLDLCYWAKSAFMMDFFYFGQKLKTGTLSADACAETFEHGDIALVQLESNLKFRRKLLPTECDSLITTQYHFILQSSYGYLLAR